MSDNRLIIGVILGAALIVGGVWVTHSPVEATTILESTDSLEVVTSGTSALDYTASWADLTSSGITPGKSSGQITTATTTTVVAAPSASTYRQLKELTIRNVGGFANFITIQRDVSATNRTIYGRVLQPLESIDMDANGTITPFDSTGVAITTSNVNNGITGTSYSVSKAGTAKDGAGFWMGLLKDGGVPGAYVLQAPGLNGFATDCSIASQTTDPNGASQMGSHPLPDPTIGSLYLKQATLYNSQAELVQLIDVLWYNTGIVTTTTTAQTITMGTLPSRDQNGTANGAGWQAALYATAALGNAAAVANTTLSYTDQDGNSGNTATFQAVTGYQAPATPVIGTWMPFTLAAGDSGIRSIQSITLGTSYVSGSMSLILYRVLGSIPVTAATSPQVVDFGNPGVKIWPNTCINFLQVGNAGAANLIGSYTIIER